MTSKEIRQQFLEFFHERGHAIVPSASVIPQDDPTLLFTNAGMNQFKPYFLGRAKPDSTRVADTQKCIRVSGKHNDLEEVGPSPYHHTFFEMLGNWSFGDYFKKEAITWAWDLMTRVYGLPKDKLYATIYETDDETEELWRGETDIEPSHVLHFGKKDNFWAMGDTGPCGPCSELHIDRGPKFDSDPKAFVNTGSPRYIELWNLVFIQYDAQKDGTLLELPAKHVDTGAGLERIATVMNGLRSNYDTDLFQPIIRAISEMSGKPYADDGAGIPHRVIADHLRCLSFAIADGAMPGNEGRGYVLRRILRRAARFGRKLDMHEPFIYKLVPVLVDVMAATFPEVKERHLHISRVMQAEEEHFGRTLDRGLERFAEVVSTVRASQGTTVPGEEAFRLYDTFGF
ncbi:MAG: alanine--tRNA ligase, partial [bacterium]|nr:alanine--tRNA ligase [bacterium]